MVWLTRCFKIGFKIVWQLSVFNNEGGFYIE